MIGEREEQSSTPPSHTSGERLRTGSDCDEEEFEFAFVIKDLEAGPEITANELFSNGQIRTVYPVFGSGLLLEPTPAAAATKQRTAETKVRGTLRRLFIEEREEDSGWASSASSSSSSAGVDELDGIPEGTYCMWAPAPSPSQSIRGKKSGSSSRAIVLKGCPRFDDFNLIPPDWGASFSPWATAMAAAYPCLERLCLKRMTVLDADLALIARSLPSFRDLTVICCDGFGTSGLATVAELCRFLFFIDRLGYESPLKKDEQVVYWMNTEF